MKKLLFLTALLLAFWCKDSSASHAAGGELLYEHISGNNYKFIFKFYRDCTGINAPNSVRLCYLNNCNVTNPNSLFLQRVAGPVLVNGDCPNITTNCTSPNGLPSYQEFIYEGNVTLTEACNTWRFWVNINARNPMNFLNSNFNNVNLYVETAFNNAISNQDNSPIFNRLPVPYCCINTPFTYDNSASDLDGDSLVYESITPRTHPTFQSCPSTPPLDCTYPAFNPPLNPISNPLPCNNTFTINPATGLFSMTPTQLGKGAIAIKVSQYRNGQLIGYIVRDIQTIVLSCNISSPSITVDTSSLNNCIVRNDTITACAGNGFSFCFNTQTSDPNSVLSIQSSLNNFSQPVSLNHSNVNTDSLYSCFNWTPGTNDTGWHFLNLLIVDSICRPIGVLNTDTLTKIFPIYIAPLTQSIVDTFVCEPGSFDGYSASGTYVDTFQNQLGCDSIRTLNLTVLTRDFTNETKSICAPGIYNGYSQSGIYIDTFTNVNGCDSIHTLNLTVNNQISYTLNQTICWNDTYFGYSQSGTYVDTFLNNNGCDSVRTINLIVTPLVVDTISQNLCEPNSYLGYTQSGIYIDTLTSTSGCDSVRVLDLTITPRTYFALNQTICAPNTFLGYSQSGVYVDTFTNAQGCDSIHTLILTVNNPSANTIINEQICAPNSFLGYSQSGTYIDTFVNAVGCDSIRILHLVVMPISYDTLQQTICSPSMYLGYNQSGTYVDTFTNSLGCDSIRTLFLNVLSPTDTTIFQSICEPNSFLGYTQSGTYVDTLIGSNGCDSVRTLVLTVIPRTYSSYQQTICEPSSYWGYSQTGVYQDTFTNANGCDSIRTLSLLVNPIKYSTVSVSVCEPASYMGYSQSGTYIDTFLSSTACDSIRTLHLTILPLSDTIISQTICEPSTYLGYSQSGTFVDTFISSNGCDSVRTLDLIVLPITYSSIIQSICEPNSYLGYFQSGIYVDTLVNAAGCDSIRTLNLTVHPLYNYTLNQTICEPDSFLGYNQSGSYIDSFTTIHGCDSIRNLVLTVLPITYLTIDTTICYPGSIYGYTSNGTYYDTLLNSSGCELRRTLNLTVQQPYFFDTTIVICQGEEVASAGRVFTTSGVYRDSLTTMHGCDSVIQTTIQVIDIPTPYLGPDQEVCEGDSIRLNPGGYDQYLWQDGDTNGIKYVNTAGTYIVRVQNDNNRCFKHDTINLNVIPYPEVAITILDDPPCMGSHVVVQGNGVMNYAWYLPQVSREILGRSDTFSVFAGINPEQILLVGWDHIKCKDSARATLIAEDCCGDILIPNAFTPNGDGLNDTYGLIKNPQIEKLDFSIFNRWGQCIFRTNNFSERWDGTFNGQICEIGTYFYMVKSKCFTEQKPRLRKGDVNLIR